MAEREGFSAAPIGTLRSPTKLRPSTAVARRIHDIVAQMRADSAKAQARGDEIVCYPYEAAAERGIECGTRAGSWRWPTIIPGVTAGADTFCFPSLPRTAQDHQWVG
jgi:hypothetical protein